MTRDPRAALPEVRESEAFQRIVSTFGGAVARVARSYAKTNAEREDLEQDISVALWRSLSSFRGECSERTFVLRVAHNRALSFSTSRRARHEASSSELDTEFSDPKPDPEVLAGLSERMRAVFGAIHELPFGLRQVLLLALEGLDHVEIGAVLGISKSNVAVRVSRARAALRKAMGEGV